MGLKNLIEVLQGKRVSQRAIRRARETPEGITYRSGRLVQDKREGLCLRFPNGNIKYISDNGKVFMEYIR